jgi:hypothetical protein
MDGWLDGWVGLINSQNFTEALAQYGLREPRPQIVSSPGGNERKFSYRYDHASSLNLVTTTTYFTSAGHAVRLQLESVGFRSKVRGYELSRTCSVRAYYKI